MAESTKWRDGVRVVRAASLDSIVRAPTGTGRATAFDFAGTGGQSPATRYLRGCDAVSGDLLFVSPRDRRRSRLKLLPRHTRTVGHTAPAATPTMYSQPNSRLCSKHTR